MLKHKRAPWRWEDGEDADLGRIVDADGKHICDFGNGEHYYPTEGTEPDEAEKLLMIAAPELLEKLQAAELLFACRCTDSTARVWLDDTRALLTRVTGAPQ